MLAKVDFFTNFFKIVFQSAVNLESRDFFDILIIAFLIYLVIELIRETHSVPVVAGVLTLLGFYGFAVFFDLALTSLVLRSFFSIFLIIIAIIFQRELRRFFSTFGLVGVARRFLPPSEATIEIVTKSASHLAAEKTGALIVFPGRDLTERHFEGGYRLEGEISEPLLLSIFDKTSPGHDGAAIIENNRLKKFAVHLPLAERFFEKVRHLGLRHRAGLGLSERSDALIIIVSEERGIISIAQNGELKQVDEDKLRKKLIDFHREKFPKLTLKNLLSWLTKNILLLGLSFFIALSIFSLVNSRFAIVQRNFAIALEFHNIPSEILINDVVPQEVILTLKGRIADFEDFRPESLRIVFDINSIKNITKPGWHRAPIDIKNIKVPFSLSAVKIEPASIQIQIVKNI